LRHELRLLAKKRYRAPGSKLGRSFSVPTLERSPRLPEVPTYAEQGFKEAVFVIQGALVGFIGLGMGIAGGVALALNIDVVVPFIQNLFGVQFLSKEVYYISDLPSDLQWGDVWGVTLIAFVLALLATIYPSWRASRVNPAEALRYE
jgi:ABC-type lipoprotein release transport system permease subunit